MSSDQPIILDKPDQIRFAQMCAQKGALKLEMVGLRRRGRSAYSIIKQQYGFKGNKESVLKQLEAKINAALEAKEHGR